VVGFYSGVGGLTAARIRDTVAAWAKAVNARGGIAGHPVQLLVADDGGNESRSVAIVRDFVENKKAIALVGYAGGTAVAVANYARSKRVPVVGGLVIEPVWNTNPMMFPTIASFEGHFFGVAKAAQAAGVRKVATVYCGDVQACAQNNDAFVRGARAVGLERAAQVPTGHVRR
jgi:branched-chain amino acid transport system substrate-binding protein